MTVKDRKGNAYDIHIEHATGSPENRMTEAFLHDKYFSLVSPILGDQKAKKILAIVDKLEEEESLQELMKLIA